MNDIEILENFIDKQKSNKGTFVPTDFEIAAIENLLIELKGTKIDLKLQETENENLIQENKELNEKQKEYEKQLDLDYVEENYIPKSKIEKALDKINERYMTPEAISNSNGATFNYWTGKRDMCIELLEEGE